MFGKTNDPCQAYTFGKPKLPPGECRDNQTPMKQRDDVTTLVVSNLQRLIESRGTNPSALAKQCGMGHTSVYDLVQGRIASPKISTLGSGSV